MKKILSMLLLAVFFCVVSVSPSYAAEEYPEVTSTQLYESDSIYVIIKDNMNNYRLHVFTFSNTSYSASDDLFFRYSKPEGSSGSIYVERTQNVPSTSAVATKIYTWKSGSSDWSLLKSSESFTDYSHLVNANVVEFKTSTVDVYDYNTGDLVFQRPPAGLEAIIQEALKTFQTQTGGTILILVLCGVGCLALLMVLKVFGKVFQAFQVK